MAFMYESKYKPHNESLQRFVDRFNRLGNRDLHIYLPPAENFYDDGIVYLDEPCCMISHRISFDWEQRHTHYEKYGDFKFNDLTQLGRKIEKDINLSLQISKDETGLLVAWHEDFYEFDFRFQYVKTEKGVFKKEKVFYTTQFIEYDISNDDGILKIKDMIESAILSHQLNSSSFLYNI